MKREWEMNSLLKIYIEAKENKHTFNFKTC